MQVKKFAAKQEANKSPRLKEDKPISGPELQRLRQTMAHRLSLIMANDDPRRSDPVSPLMIAPRTTTATRANNKSLPPVVEGAAQRGSMAEALRSFNLSPAFDSRRGHETSKPRPKRKKFLSAAE